MILQNVLKSKKKTDIEIDIGSFFELAEENNIIHYQMAVNTLIEDMEKLKFCFFKNGCFTLGDKGEIITNSFFIDSSGLAKFIDKSLDKFDEHPSIYYT